MVAHHLFTPPDPPHHPALLEKAQGSGRIRGTALEIYKQVLEHPQRASSILSTALRQARHLHSRERRFVADSLYALIRYQPLLQRLGDNDTPETLWQQWLLWQGLPSESAVSPSQLVEQIIREQPPTEALSLIGNFDPAIADALTTSLNDDIWPFLWASNTRGLVTLRTNPVKATRASVQQTLLKQDIPTEALESGPYALRVMKGANLMGQRSYQQGWFEIQDAGSQDLAALCPPDAQRVIDYCAGAGGKTLAIGAANPNCEILACDVRQPALRELQKRSKRAGLKRIQTHCLSHGLPKKKADVVFVDAPCSGLGTLRGHPEVRLNLNANTLGELQQLQDDILRKAATLVSDGGMLIYGTCSVLRTENESAVQRFLTHHPMFSAHPDPPLKRAPHTHDTDGFFGQRLIRTG